MWNDNVDTTQFVKVVGFVDNKPFRIASGAASTLTRHL